MIRLLHDLSRFAQLLDHLQRLNVSEALVLFLLAQDIRNARQFEDSAVVENLVAKLKERQVQCNELRSCSWRHTCFECDVIFSDQARQAAVIRPGMPLLPKYRQAALLYKNIGIIYLLHHLYLIPRYRGDFRLAALHVRQ